MIVRGVFHVANCAVVYFAVGFGAATMLTRRPPATRVLGIVLVDLGAVLIIDKMAALS